MKSLKFCVFGECNEIQTIIDGEFKEHLQGVIWLHFSVTSKSFGTAYLSPINYHFTYCFEGFNNLEDLVVEDCSEINNILSHNVPAKDANPWMRFLPNLKLSLHYMPKLVSSSGGSPFAPKLEWLSVYASKPG